MVLWQAAAGLSLPTSSSSRLSYEGSGTAASLITMTDCSSVGISHMVIVVCACVRVRVCVCVEHSEEEEGHYSLAFPFLSLLENSQRLRSDWLERKSDVS